MVKSRKRRREVRATEQDTQSLCRMCVYSSHECVCRTELGHDSGPDRKLDNDHSSRRTDLYGSDHAHTDAGPSGHRGHRPHDR